MKANTKNNNPITMNGEPLEETDSFTYLSSTINNNGGTEEDVEARIQKARQCEHSSMTAPCTGKGIPRERGAIATCRIAVSVTFSVFRQIVFTPQPR
ncbi:hypothetical protein NP493_61g04015 [Ridgeia piscesae]|uniref:Uncharacterized protein n=1 Tax=Ridgeia piscesae TaxID=27915 RepID=A0AAD9PAR8_RIDPI|nr:hypothetical protein NP493_61g04015 [Ridgeia piscesae]